MLQSAYVEARKAIESLYDCTCDILEYQEVEKKNKSIGFEETIVIENQPCRISFETLSAVISTEEKATERVISSKLFISPDITIKEGSKITVTKKDVKTDYKSSGVPAIYETHQEIMLEPFERWT